MDNDLITVACFHASIPTIQSACSFGGDGSVRIKLDIPATERDEVLALMSKGLEADLIVTVHKASEVANASG